MTLSVTRRIDPEIFWTITQVSYDHPVQQRVIRKDYYPKTGHEIFKATKFDIPVLDSSDRHFGADLVETKTVWRWTKEYDLKAVLILWGYAHKQDIIDLLADTMITPERCGVVLRFKSKHGAMMFKLAALDNLQVIQTKNRDLILVEA